MSEYTLVQRGVIAATVADTTGPKDFTLASPIKTASAFVVSSIKSVRCRKRVQHFTINLTDASVSPVITAIPNAVDRDCSHIEYSIREVRADPNSGVALILIAGGATFNTGFGTIGVGEKVDLEVAVIEDKEPSGATVRILDPTTVRLEWDGTLAAGETIDASFDVFDLEDLGDDIKEILFRQVRLLGYNGENAMQDLITFDTQGNMLTYRVRTFNSKVNMDAATPDETGALVTGELARITFTQTIKVAKNDRTLSTEALTDIAPNPDIT